MHRFSRMLLILLLATVLAACGAKGDLVMPSPDPAETVPATN